MPRLRWSNLARHGLLGTTLLGLASTAASADPCDTVESRTIALVLGIDVAPRLRLIGGIEARQCLTSRTDGLLRIELGGGAPRLIGGLHARPFERAATESLVEQLGVEAGAGLDTHGRLGLHLGATLGEPAGYLALQTRFVLGDPPQPARYSLLGGLAPWAVAEEMVVEGRPLVRAGQLVRPALATLPPARSAEARAARDHFASSAQLELSSVTSFLRLAAELAAVGAPAALIARALDAADDELRHAEQCAAAAGGVALWTLPAWLAQPRFTARSPHALAILATEAWREGCLNETAAAEEARLASAEADGPIRAILAAIAGDEAGHAALSWSVLEWTFAVAPATTAAALAGLPQVASATEGADLDPALVRRGVPSRAMTAAARGFAATTARARLAALTA